jgi:arylsulfatase A-like enzyme
MRIAQMISSVHHRLPTLLAAGVVCSYFGVAMAYGTTSPNIVLILTDDQGWADSSVVMDPTHPGLTNTYYRTPNLQSMADAGMRFSNGYSAAPQCAQTRAALLTGKSPAQLQMTDLVWWQSGSGAGLPLSGPIPELFDPTQLTLPRVVKQADPNYRTALIGKWHLDLPGSTNPITSGFDQWQVGGQSPTDPQGVFKIAQHTNSFMESSVASGKPFFVQVAHDAVHELYDASGRAWIPSRPEIADKYRSLPTGVPEYAALVEDLDTSVGQVLGKINELGIADNTYVFYVSDNGGSVKWTSNLPLKEGKGAIFDGGIRIPYIVKGPGIQAGAFSDVAVSTTDLLATIASLVGATGPEPPGLESADLSPVLFNGGDLPQDMPHLDRGFAQRGELYFHYPHYAGAGLRAAHRPASAVRDGDYKLYVEYDELGGPDRVSLYDMAQNPGENNNLATQMPQKAAELKGMLDNYLQAVDASMPYDV